MPNWGLNTYIKIKQGKKYFSKNNTIKKILKR